MRVSKFSTDSNPVITIEKTDIDNVLLHRLEEIMDYINSYFTEIKNREKGFYEISLQRYDDNFLFHSYEESDFVIGARYFLDYLQWWKRQPGLDIKIKNVINKVFEGQTNLPSNSKNFKSVEQDRWFLDYVRKLKQVEDYYSTYFDNIQNNVPESQTAITPPLINKLLAAYGAKETAKMLEKPKLKTLWTTLYKDFELKKITSGVSASTIKEYRYKLSILFDLMKRKTIESITDADLRKVSYDIQCIPKNWKRTTGKKLKHSDFLERGAKGTLSLTSVKDYLILLGDFLNYAYERDIIDVNMKKYIVVPKKDDKVSRDMFEPEELIKIFNPATYPSRYNNTTFAKFWVPLIALYSGARAGEICQLKVDDIIKKNGVWCFYINADDDEKFLKNRQSERYVPIHPVIKELGFIDFVEEIRKHTKGRIFHTLTWTENNRYSSMVLKWFGRYLDKIDIISKKKVFHSFRHTFETKCVEKKITAEIQNQICGWVNKGVGQRIYNKGVDIKDLYKEIKKIQYPELVKCLPHFMHDTNQTDYSVEILKIPTSKPRKPRKVKLVPRV